MSALRGALGRLGVAGLLTMAMTCTATAAAPVVRKLDNGMKVAVLADPRLPVAQIQLMVPAGSVRENSREHGAARLVAALLKRGTTSRSAEQFAAEVERLGGTLATNASLELATVSAAFRAEDLDAGLELLADAAINPLFEDAQVSALRSELLRAILQSRRHPGVLADEHAWALAMPAHPYAVPELGTLESVAELTHERLRDFHRSCYRPDQALLVIAGDVDPEAAFRAATEHFGGWKGAGRPTKVPPATPRSAPAIRLIDIPGARDAEVRMVFLAPPRHHDDALPLMVANEILGGASSTRLGGGGRSPRGFSFIDLRHDAGLWAIGSSVRADSVGALVTRLQAELRRLVADPLTAPEVEAAGRTLARSFTIANESLTAQAGQWLSASFHGLGDDLIDRHPALVAEVKPDQVRAAVSRWLVPERVAIVVAGAAERIKPQLESLGAVEVVTPESPTVALAPSPAMDMSAPAPEALSRGREIAERGVKAHGGAAKLKGIKDATQESEITLYADERTATGKQREMRREPTMLRLEVDMGQLATVQGLQGDQAWVRVNAPADSVMDGDSLVVDGLKAVFHSDVIHLLLATQQPGSRLVWRGEDAIATRPADVVELTTAEGRRTVLYFDKERHDLVAAEDNQGSALAGPVLRRVFGEPRTIQGLVLPHLEERYINGQRTLILKTTRIALNAGIDPGAFEKPGKSGPRPRRR